MTVVGWWRAGVDDGIVKRGPWRLWRWQGSGANGADGRCRWRNYNRGGVGAMFWELSLSLSLSLSRIQYPTYSLLGHNSSPLHCGIGERRSDGRIFLAMA